MFGQEGTLSIEHQILKENHETLEKDYQSLRERSKLEEETYEMVKKHLQSKSKQLEAANIRLFEEREKERSDKDKAKKMLEEMKSELVIRDQERSLAKRKKAQEFEKMENKYVALADKLGVVEAECANLKSLYDAQVAAASGTTSAVMSGIGDTQGEDEVNHNVNTDEIVISDESDAEHDDNPVRESNITTQLNENQATRQVFTSRSVNQPPPISDSPSSSSSGGYDVPIKLPADWPDWAISKGSGEESNQP